MRNAGLHGRRLRSGCVLWFVFAERALYLLLGGETVTLHVLGPAGRLWVLSHGGHPLHLLTAAEEGRKRLLLHAALVQDVVKPGTVACGGDTAAGNRDDGCSGCGVLNTDTPGGTAPRSSLVGVRNRQAASSPTRPEENNSYTT